MDEDQVKEAIAAAINGERAAYASAMSIKLPPFWTQKSALWFAQAEAQFAIKGITVDKTKYCHVVAMLDNVTASHVMDIIGSPPDANAYNTLKTSLTEAFAITDDEKAAKIMNTSGLADKTQSQLLSSMLLLVPQGEVPGFLFRKVYLHQLPSDVQTHLAQTRNMGTSAANLRKLATEADRYFSSAGNRITTVTVEEPEVNAAGLRSTQNRSYSL